MPAPVGSIINSFMISVYSVISSFMVSIPSIITPRDTPNTHE